MFHRKSGLGAALVLCGLVGGIHPVSAQTLYSILDLGVLPGDFSSAANGLNDSGQVVGISQSSAGATHGFLYSGGNMTDVGSLGGDTIGQRVDHGSGAGRGEAVELGARAIDIAGMKEQVETVVGAVE